jgi:hypothetical protein
LVYLIGVFGRDVSSCCGIPLGGRKRQLKRAGHAGAAYEVIEMRVDEQEGDAQAGQAGPAVVPQREAVEEEDDEAVSGSSVLSVRRESGF